MVVNGFDGRCALGCNLRGLSADLAIGHAPKLHGAIFHGRVHQRSINTDGIVTSTGNLKRQVSFR